MDQGVRSEEADPQVVGSAPLGAPGWGSRQLLVRAALESILIVLSVFLALFLDEWRADRAAQERVDTARAYLVRELKTNRDRLSSDRILPYHRRTAALLDEAIGEGPKRDAAFARLSSEFTGVHPFFPQSVAWRSFGSPEITQRLPPEELFMLAQIYDQQEILMEITRGFTVGMTAPAYNDGSEAGEIAAMRAIRMYLSDAVPNEAELLVMYDVALRRLNADPS